jgi:hypothetical protein
MDPLRSGKIDFPIITTGGKLRDASEAEPEGSLTCRISEISIQPSRRNHFVTNEEFLRAFEECRIPKAFWTHEAHVRMAWLYLRLKPLEEVIPLVRERIHRYNASLGNTSGYHETVTLAYLALIDHRLDRGTDEQTFRGFAGRHPDLLDRKLSALLGHDSRDLLFSTQAVERFVEPDLVPLPRRVNESPGG